MTITAKDQYYGVCRISREKFSRMLVERAHPEVVIERDPGQYWDKIREMNCDPLYILAMFGKESTFGNYGVAVTSKSWGNTRAPNFGAKPIGDMAGRTGRFPIWKSYMDGCISTVARLMTNDWYYMHEKRNIGEVNNDPHFPTQDTSRPIFGNAPRTSPAEWAPAGDLNSPSGYLNFMLSFMNEHSDMNEPISKADNKDKWGKVARPSFSRVAHVPKSNYNRPGGKYEKRWITIHETGNSSVGANAEMHRRFVANGGGVHRVSFHHVVDDREAIELLPDEEQAFHAGDGWGGEGNAHSVAIEICVNADGNFNKALTKTAILVVYLLDKHNLTPADIKTVQHNRWSGKNCPSRLRAGGWSQFVQNVVSLQKKGDVKVAREFPTGHQMNHGFRGAYEDIEKKLGHTQALLLLGYPVTGEFEEDGMVVQYTERGRFEWHPGLDKKYNRHQVLFGRTGAELIEAKARIAELEEQVRKLGADPYEPPSDEEGYEEE
jgi:hypothetical protein